MPVLKPPGPSLPPAVALPDPTPKSPFPPTPFRIDPVTLSYRLTTLSLTALGAVLGFGLAGAVAFQPVQAFAQAVEAAPAPVATP